MTDSSQKIEETLRRISNINGVKGYTIVNNRGIPIRSNMDEKMTTKYASLITSLVNKSNESVKKLDNGNELTFLRLRTKMHEVLVAPEKEYTMIVIQNTNYSGN